MVLRLFSNVRAALLLLVVISLCATLWGFAHLTFAHSAASPTAKVLFNGVDTTFARQLWVTDGTVAGTQELTTLACGFPAGVNPQEITSLGSKAVFEGCSSSLWVTDGTPAGTYELAAIPNAASTGIAPGDLTAFGSEALFDGYDSNGNNELWITDGTAAGTRELTSIRNASFYELNFGDITVVGNEAFFTGYDASGAPGIWATNGTAAGTYELSITTPSGIVYPVGSDLTAFGNKVLFHGRANALNSELWVTDGTSAGTQQLNNAEPFDIVSFGSQALFTTMDGNIWMTNGTAAGTTEVTDDTTFDLGASDITAFGQQALFTGNDARGHYGIWVTDGTTAGTQELITLLCNYSTYSNDLTALGQQALFYGVDANGASELWTTDGTPTGTRELTTITGSNYYSGLEPSDITPIGGGALFSGYDASGNNQLWSTDGTSSGTQPLANVAGSDNSGFSPVDMTLMGTGQPAPTVKWLSPQNDFMIQQGQSISLSVQADPGAGGSPIATVDFSAAWAATASPGADSGSVCTLTAPDQGTTDDYSCTWNFTYQSTYVPGGTVVFHVTVTDASGNQAIDPGGPITGTFGGTRQSYLWGGYGAYSPNGSPPYSEVVGSWKVPAVQACGKGETSFSLAWVGLGGVDTDTSGNGALEQIGTESACGLGETTYQAWYEMVPSPLVTFATVAPGDTITATVEYTGTSQIGLYSLLLSVNGATPQSFSLSGSAASLARNAAECIQEDPAFTYLNTPSPFVDFGSITFTSRHLVTSGTNQPINSGPLFNTYELISKWSDAHHLETLSSLTTTTTDSSFTATWKAAS